MFELAAGSLAEDWSQGVRRLEVAGDDAGRVEQIRELEELKRAASAAQARVAAELVASQRAEQVAAGVPNRRAHRGVAEQVALARGESPHRGGTFVGMATALVHEMPCTMAALSDGRITEWAATCLVRETAVLQVHDRAEVDAQLQRMLDEAGTSEGKLIRAAKGLAQKLDPQSAVARAAKAETDRRSRSDRRRTRWSTSARCCRWPRAWRPSPPCGRTPPAPRPGDPRSRGQLMADAFVARVTGRDPLTDPVAVHVDLVMTDTTLLGAGRAPATVRALGQVPVPIPGPVARTARRPAPVPPGRAWLRRLYTSPDRTTLVAMDSRARRFPEGLARLVELSDQSCRTPWCDAPIAETDHVEPVADDGPTTRDNAQGLCRRCNLAKQAPGWSAQRDPDGTVRTTTPTGHTYTSRPPPPLGTPTPRGAEPVVQLNHAMLAWHRRKA